MWGPFFLCSKKDIVWITLGVIISIAESIANPASTILIGLVFKDVQKVLSQSLQPEKLVSNVQTYVYCLVGSVGYSILCGCLGYWLWMGLGHELGHKARASLYRAMVQRPSHWLDEKSDSGGLAMAYMKDIQDLEMATGIASFEIISMFIGCIAEIGVAFYFSWSVTLICLAGIPVLMIINSLCSSPIAKALSESKSTLDKANKRVTWVFSALETVKLFQRETYEQRKFDAHITKSKNKNITYRSWFALQEGLSRTVVLMIFMQGFYFGSFMVKHHGSNAGDVITVFWSCLNASALLQSLISHLLEWNKGKISALRIAEAIKFDEEKESYDSIGSAPHTFNTLHGPLENLGWQIDKSLVSSSIISQSEISDVSYKADRKTSLSYDHEIECKLKDNHIEFNDVVFSYPSRPGIIFSGVNMEFPHESTTFISGHSGSGKSSVGSLLTKQYEYQAGEIIIEGRDLSLLSKLWIARNVYVCEQSPKLFDISIKDNIRIGSCLPTSVPESYIEVALSDSCAEFVYDSPQGIDTMELQNLSGGQRQRLALARARIRDAPVMIFDEATSALDEKLQREIYEKILSYRKGKTTIIITHDLTIIPKAYPIYYIHDGVAQFFEDLSKLQESHAFTFQSAKPQKDESTNEETRDSRVCTTNTSASSPARNDLLVTPKIITARCEMVSFYDLFKSIPEKSWFLIGMIFSGLHASVNPVFSFVFSRLLMGILDPSASKTTMWAMLLLMCSFVDGMLSFCKVTLSISAEKWLQWSRSSLFGNISNQSNSKFRHEEVAYYSKLLLSDSEKCAEIITQYWPAIVAMIILGIVSFVWALISEWKLTLVGISLLPVFVLLSFSFKKLTTHWMRLRERKRNRVVSLLLDVTSDAGIKTSKLQHLELFFKKFYMEREDHVHSLTRQMNLQVGIGYGTSKCFPYALESLLIWYGMKLLGNGLATAQNVMSVFSLLMFTIITIDQLTASIVGVSTGFEVLPRLIPAINTLSKTSEETQLSSLCHENDYEKLKFESVRFHHVSVDFGKVFLNDFSLFIEKGETVALMGASGIGKSTIARCLERFVSPAMGEIVIDEHWDLQILSLFEIRQNIGLVEQAPVNFFDGTIKENSLYSLHECESNLSQKMIEVCKSCGAHEYIERLDKGYDTRINSGLLSGGQMQRLAIARTLIRDPKILILDECSSALDVDSMEKIKSLITSMKQKRNMIIIIITHQYEFANVADRIISL